MNKIQYDKRIKTNLWTHLLLSIWIELSEFQQTKQDHGFLHSHGTGKQQGKQNVQVVTMSLDNTVHYFIQQSMWMATSRRAFPGLVSLSLFYNPNM